MRIVNMVCVGLLLVACQGRGEEVRAKRSVESLIQQLQGGSDEQRVRAAQELAEYEAQAAAAVPALQSALESPDANLRGWAATALGAIGPEAQPAAEALLKLLDDEQPVDQQPVWERAGRALGRIGKQNVPALLPLLKPDDPSYRGAAAALFELHADAAPALPQVIEILEKRQVPVGPAIYVIQGLGPAAKDAMPVLMDLLDYETDPPFVGMHIQYWACQALRDIGPEAAPATEKLIEKLSDGKGSVRRHAAQALGAIGPAAGDKALEALLAATDDQLQPVRRDALLALAKFGTAAQAYAPQIKELSRNEDKSVQAVAAGALWHIEPAEREYAVEVLLKELTSIHTPWEAAQQLGTIAPQADAVLRVAKLLAAEDPLTREHAAYALGLMGPAAKPAARQLQALVAKTEEEPDIRQAAYEALQHIFGKSSPEIPPDPTGEKSPLE